MLNSKLSWLILGAMTVLVALLLVGATDVSAPHYGRYQLSSWSASIDDEHAVVGAFIIDTATGETKTVYTRAIDANGKGAVFKNNLKKTFHSIQ